MKHIARSEAIEWLRQHLLTLVDEEHSLCLVAGQEGVFCGGLAQWTDEELAARFPWVDRFRHPRSRAEFERRVNRWLLNRQHLPSGRLPCDLPGGEGRPKPCHGWDEFYEAELAGFIEELSGEEVRVEP